MHKWLIIICWLLAAHTAAAQQTDSLIVPQNEWLIKVSPLALFETDGGIGFSGEYVMPKSRLGIQLEIQPILFDLYRNNGSNGIEAPDRVHTSGMPRGVKLRPGIRYYVDGLHSKPYYPPVVTKGSGKMRRRIASFRTYIAVDLLLKQTWTKRLGDVRMNNGGTQGGYLLRTIYTDIKQVLGFDFKLGSVISLSPANRLFLEPYLGLGFRYKKFRYKNLPVGASEPERSNFGIPTDVTYEPNIWHNGMSLPIGLKLVYKLL